MSALLSASARSTNRPRLRPLEPKTGERHASWLELFFDLVFVLAVSQISRILSYELDLIGLLQFAVLFIPVWWSWIGYTFYADRFETNETIYRVLMFVGMLGVAGLSVAMPGSFTEGGGAPFIACLLIVRLTLVTLYIRAAYYVPLARLYCYLFIFGLSISSSVLVGSLLLDPPLRIEIWAVIFLAELLIPFANLRVSRLTPIDGSHIPERFGLFTIIVLGEAVIAAAMGANSVRWNLATVTIGALGFAMAACIWWINFDFVEDNAIRSSSLAKRFVYLYGHFFMVSSIVATAVGVEHAIEESNEPHLHASTLMLIACGIAIYLTVVTVIRLFTGVCNMVYARIITIALSLVLMYAGGFLTPILVMTAMFLVLLGGIWVETLFSPAKSQDTELRDESFHLVPCDHAGEAQIYKARSEDGCEECRKNNYKWVHLRLCLSCGHVGCCDSSVNRHATKHFRQTGHPLMASLEIGEHWSWCYIDDRFVPLSKEIK